MLSDTNGGKRWQTILYTDLRTDSRRYDSQRWEMITGETIKGMIINAKRYCIGDGN